MQLINNSVVSLTSNQFSYAIYNKELSHTMLVTKDSEVAKEVFNTSVLYVAKLISLDMYKYIINKLIV